MVTSLTETSNETNKSLFTNACALLFISNLYHKNFKQLCLDELFKKNYAQKTTFKPKVMIKISL